VSDRIQNIAQLDRLVHEPARLKILLILEGVAEADFLYLQREGEFTQGNLSSHLNKLEEAGYVEIEKKFKGKLPLTICRLTPGGKGALSAYSGQMLRILRPEGGSGSKAGRSPK
jgi:DNA-binding transcriptional ArsR family regulator